MYISILLVALIAQTALGKPTNCGDYCDDQSTRNYGHSRSSYSSYSKSSYGQQRMLGGFGGTNGKLENFDENVIGTSGLNRPGNWKDEKHYVTNDGRGEMEYSAGQTVTNNGYSKFAHHSYSYGTNDHHTPRPNSQILSSPAEFNSELQNIRSRIANFMRNFNFGSDSSISTNTLQDFMSKASLISSQMNSVCDQVGVGSSMYDQMQQMMQEFQRNVEQKQHEMEAMIYQQTTSSSSSSITQVTSRRKPTVPSTQYQVVPTIVNYPSEQTVHEETLIEERVEEQISMVQSLLSTFYTSFNRPDASLQYQQDLNNQVNVINQKLNDLSYESVQNVAVRERIASIKAQFETYVTKIRTRIQEIEARNQEEERKHRDREQQLLLQKQQFEEKMKRIEEERRIQEEQAERIRQQQLEAEEKLRQEQEYNMRIRQEQQEAERLRQQMEAEEKMRQEAERRRQQQLEAEQKLRREQDYLRIRQEEERGRQIAAQQQRPQVTGSFEVKGSSSYEHTIKGSYQSTVSGASNGGHHWTPTPNPQPLQPHVDLTAAVSRLQQDLNRLQNEVNNFNRYTMRLTSSNTASVVTEAERQAETLRHNINNLCETSSKYNNQDILTSAEELKRRFEELFQSFQSQAASYSSESSYSSSGHYSSVRKPKITNVEMEHSKSLEVEIGRRPASSQHHSSGTYSASSGVYPGSEVDGQLKHGLIDLGGGSSSQQVECVETYAGQPCVDRIRYRRHVGGK